jgi:hypothetical protein
VPQHVHVIDAVRARGHPGDQATDFRCALTPELSQISGHAAGDGHDRAPIRIGTVPMAAVLRGGATRGTMGEAGRAGCWLTAGYAVDLLAEDVGVTGVAGRLASHMGQQPPQRQPLAADASSQQRLRVTGRDDRRVALGDGRAVVADNRLGGTCLWKPSSRACCPPEA